MPKTIIISNRLPVKIDRTKSKLEYKTSEGGLATGLGSIYKTGDNLWLGWPGMVPENKEEISDINTYLKSEQMRAVYLSEQEVKDFYEGFSNETLWPNFHYFNQYTVYDDTLWDAYKSVNQKFCDSLAPLVEPGDTIWVHDYQLLLLPELVRNIFPEVSIGFFQHIPFPSYEAFRQLPWRRELLEGMLGADLVGFHTYDDMRHFLSSVNRLAGIGYTQGKIELQSRTVQVDAFPMGIDYDKYAAAASDPETLAREARYRSAGGEQQYILSIDRLDYSKGIPQRLRAFEAFLKKYPQYKKKVSLIMVVVPSRDTVPKYRQIKEEIDELVGRINGTYSRMGWNPIFYFYRSFPLPALSAFYRMAQVALVTPMRDGMNLVCKEFVASKLDKKGVLILSEMAGSSKELSDAILINPTDMNQLVDALHDALEMPVDEQIKRMDALQASIKRYNIYHWVEMFMSRLDSVKKEQESFSTRKLNAIIETKLLRQYESAKKRLIFLDYDGTLMTFESDPNSAKPDTELNSLLSKLCADKNNKVVIISGRDKGTLTKWLSEFNLDMIAEHGVWLHEYGSDWEIIEGLDNSWQQKIQSVLDLYVDRTPGSFIEKKDYSLVWHYRKVETGLGELRTRELTSHLKHLVSNQNLQVLEGNKVVEVKNSIIDKGVAAKIWLEKHETDFVMAIGDDWTDEDTFKAMPEGAITIKVGSIRSVANFNLSSVVRVREFLEYLVTKS